MRAVELFLVGLVFAAPASAPQSLVLDVESRDQAPERPSAGWCAETAIQEALLHHGVYVPQRTINRAGKPRMPDLYWDDVPVALKALGVSYERWSGDGGFGDFIAWTEEHLRNGHPLVTGVKIHPTEHPRWGLDHVVLVVGYDAGQALYLDTTWGTRERRTHADLQAMEGLSLANRHGKFYAFAIRGMTEKRAPGAVPVRLSAGTPGRDRAGQIHMKIRLEGLVTGKTYRLTRHELGKSEPAATREITAGSAVEEVAEDIPGRTTAVYGCTAVDR